MTGSGPLRVLGWVAACCLALWLPHLGHSWLTTTTSPIILRRSTSSRVGTITMAAPLKAGDRVVVIGATGGVGQLVAARLASEKFFKVRAVGRDAGRAKDVLQLDGVEYAGADTKDLDTLLGPLSDADAVVIATGTSAFPSKRWKDGNNPDAVDRKGVRNILQALTSKPRKKAVKKVVFLSSVGTLRTKQIPYSILNLFGVLDAKRDSEIALKSTAQQEGWDFVTVRPGRLVGGPYTNTDVSALLKVQEGTRKSVQVVPGDDLVGDAARISVAELVARVLRTKDADNQELSIVSQEGERFTDADWKDVLSSLK